MTTAFAPAVHRTAPLRAAIDFKLVDGRSVVTRLCAGNPLKLLVPRQNDRSAWVIAATFGGGMLADDRINLDVRCHPGSCGMLATQASTKIYKSPAGAVATQTLHATIDEHATLAVLPDPVTCFAGARYEQRQRFQVASNGSLLLLDWLTCGRLARGERWVMQRYLSVNDIHVADRHLAHDAMLLDGASGRIDSLFRVGRFNCLASCFVIGPAFAGVMDGLIKTIHSRKLERQADLLLTANPIGTAGVMVRLAGTDVELIGRAIRKLLEFVTPVLGENPWSRKW